MADKECTKCIHHPVCKTAESCDGFVSGCKHFVVISNLETTTREKLIELLEYANELADEMCERNCAVCRYDQCGYNCSDVRIAEALIAHGVMVQEWISVKDKLPDRNDMVIAFYPTMRGTSGEMQIHKAWAMSETCTHWIPRPQPPKGE
jgi:hypothetical protein